MCEMIRLDAREASDVEEELGRWYALDDAQRLEALREAALRKARERAAQADTEDE